MCDNLVLEMNDHLPLRDVVFNTLRKAILRGEIKPNERLLELQLATKLGVSRTPVREAIRKLELEGLVVMVPRKGAKVAQITIKSLKDVLEVRRVLETLAAEMACRNVTNEQLDELRHALAKFKEAKKYKDLTDIAEADVYFHDLIYKATDNSKLIGILSNLREQMYRYRIEYIKDSKSHETLLAEHIEMLEAISAHDAKAAGEIAKRHIDNQEETIIRALKENNR